MEPMKIERRRATMLPAFRPKRRTLDREQLLTVAKYAALTLAGILLFRAGQARALIERGCAAVGGEAFALFLPALYYMISRTVRDVIADKQGSATCHHLKNLPYNSSLYRIRY